jgi:hypothetical protein
MGLPSRKSRLYQCVWPQVWPGLPGSGMGCLERPTVPPQGTCFQHQLSRYVLLLTSFSPSLPICPGADQASFTLNFSRGASQIIGQYYQLIRLGKRGYRAIMTNLTRTADYLSANLSNLGFVIMSKGKGEGLPLVAFRLDPSKNKVSRLATNSGHYC